MTTLAAGWENMGGRVLRRTADGDTIQHPLNGPLPGQTSLTQGVYNVFAWENQTAADFPGNLGAEGGAPVTANTLAAAFAADPAYP